jgi:hypothetical protein
MLQFLKGSIAFHRLHSKTIPTDIPIFISLNFCLDFDILTFTRLQVHPAISAEAYNQYVCFSSS